MRENKMSLRITLAEEKRRTERKTGKILAHIATSHNYTFVLGILSSRSCHVRSFVPGALHLRQAVHSSFIALGYRYSQE